MLWWILACASDPASRTEPDPPAPLVALASLSEVLTHVDAGEHDAALALMDPRCAAEPEGWACTLAAHLRATAHDVRRCAEGDGEACLSACEQVRAPESCEAAKGPAEEACADGEARACTVRAEAGVVTGEDDDVVNRWLWTGCDTVDPLACLRLADRLERGLGERPAKARGGIAWLRNQGCDLQLDYACAPHR